MTRAHLSTRDRARIFLAADCPPCHKVKTSEVDIPLIAKTKRIQYRHIGAKAPSRNPLPGGRASKFKKKVSGEVVLR